MAHTHDHECIFNFLPDFLHNDFFMVIFHLFLFWGFITISNFLIDKFTNKIVSYKNDTEFEKQINTLKLLFKSIIDTIWIVFAVMYILNMLGVDIRPLLTAAGIVGVTQQDISYCIVEGAQIRGIDGNSNKVSGIATFRGGTAAISNCAIINTAISSGGHVVFGPNADSGTVTSTNNKYWKITYLDMTENNAYVPAGNAQDGEAFAAEPVQADFEAIGYDFTSVWKWNTRNGAPKLQKVGCSDDVVVEEETAA